MSTHVRSSMYYCCFCASLVEMNLFFKEEDWKFGWLLESLHTNDIDNKLKTTEILSTHFCIKIL